MLAIFKLDARLKKLERKERVVTGFCTDVQGHELPITEDDGDWPDDEFFYVEDQLNKKGNKCIA